MTLALRHGDANGVANPVIFFAAIRPGPAGDATNDAGAGFLLDPTSLTYRLVNPDGTELQATTAVDLMTERLGVGRFAPTFTINDTGGGGLEAAAAAGFAVEWTAVIPFGGGSTTVTKTTIFRLIPATEPLVNAYATVSDMRDEGVPTGGTFTDARVRVALERAKAFIDRVTMRTFKPEYKNIDVDGEGGPILQIDEPIIAMEEVNFTFTTFSPTDLPVEEGDLRVYNRHIRENLTQPDDREDPRLEFLRLESLRGVGRGFDTPVRFTDSQQNMNLVGLFGYTEWDGSPTGRTPDLIVWANMRLAMRYLRPMFGNVSMGGPAPAGPITMEKTRDQAVHYANPAAGTTGQSTSFSGDPEVDQVLASFMRPPDFVAV